MSGPDINISRDDILSRARQMVPVLQERARDAEIARRIPNQTDQEFRDAGFYRIMQPKNLGGLELDFGTQTELAVILGPGCASSAWVASVTACHGWLIGMFPAKAQEEIWGKDPETTIASSFLGFKPEVKKVNGGLHVNGRWGFSSGVDHCRWAVIQIMLSPDENSRPSVGKFAVIPLDDCKIVDNWHATGLTAVA